MIKDEGLTHLQRIFSYERVRLDASGENYVLTFTKTVPNDVPEHEATLAGMKLASNVAGALSLLGNRLGQKILEGHHQARDDNRQFIAEAVIPAELAERRSTLDVLRALNGDHFRGIYEASDPTTHTIMDAKPRLASVVEGLNQLLHGVGWIKAGGNYRTLNTVTNPKGVTFQVGDILSKELPWPPAGPGIATIPVSELTIDDVMKLVEQKRRFEEYLKPVVIQRAMS